MGDFSDLERRIEQLRMRASSGPVCPELEAEIESALSDGYVSALRADARSYRLREQVEALVEDVDKPFTADNEEVLRLARERRAIAESTSRLRERLAILRAVGARSRSA